MNKSNFSHMDNLNTSCLHTKPYFLIKAFKESV